MISGFLTDEFESGFEDGEHNSIKFTPYNAIVWLTKHIYLPGPNHNDVEKRKTEIENLVGGVSEEKYWENPLYKDQYLVINGEVSSILANEFEGGPYFYLTEDDIDVIQQCAFWYFSNYDQGFMSNISDLLPVLSINSNTLDGAVGSETDLHVGRLYQMNALYNYLVNTAKKEAGTDAAAYCGPVPPEVMFRSSADAKLEEKQYSWPEGSQTDYYVVGPFELNKTGTDIWDVVITPSFTYNLVSDPSSESVLLDNDIMYGELDNTGNNIITDGYKTDINEITNDTPFVIAVPKDKFPNNTPINSIIKFTVKLDYTYSRTKREATLWTAEIDGVQQQPVLKIDDVDKEFTDLIDEVPVDNIKFDLSLRKFISKIERDTETIFDITRDIDKGRIPEIDAGPLINNPGKTAIYRHSKQPLMVKNGDIITYTIRVYNEGNVRGKVKKITDYIPKGLDFIIEDNEYMWIFDPETRIAYTEYWSTDRTGESENCILDVFNPEASQTEKLLDYRDVQIRLRVNTENKFSGMLVNIAEITGAVAVDTEDRELDLTDRDSKEVVVMPEVLQDYMGDPNEDNYDISNLLDDSQNYYAGQEDDDDFERVQISYFDLSLRKFITEVNGEVVGENYSTPYPVANGDEITYIIRVYNEGKTPGYAEELLDDIPKGLEYLPNNQTNMDYKWKMYKYNEDKTKLIEVENVVEAEVIKTTYLSEENGIIVEELNSNLIPSCVEGQEPSYKDVKVVFKVNESLLPEENVERFITNLAQIGQDNDDDVDSTPGKWIEGDDDQDFEQVYVQKFDLSLLKWVTKTIVTVDGKTTTTETGFLPNQGLTDQEKPITDGLIDRNEPVAQVVINSRKYKKTDVKIVYKIRVTNEGELPGYVSEITDYIPEGLEFVEADNPGWSKVPNTNKIITKALDGVLIEPNYYYDLDVVLRWKKDKDNFGIKKNIAAITEDYNAFGDTEDIDSQPEEINEKTYQKEQQDDDDFALVVFTVKTGSEMTYFTLTLTVLTIIATGILFIKRYVLV